MLSLCTVINIVKFMTVEKFSFYGKVHTDNTVYKVLQRADEKSFYHKISIDICKAFAPRLKCY